MMQTNAVTPRRCFGITGVTKVTKLFVASLLMLYIAMAVLNWVSLFLVPLLFIVPVVLMWQLYACWLRRGGDPFDDMFGRMMCAGFWPGALVVSLVELPLTLIFGSVVLFADEDEGASVVKNAASSPVFYVSAFLLSYGCAALVEEVAKAMLVRCTCVPRESSMCVQVRDLRSNSQARATLALMLAGALGFSLAENFGYCISLFVTVGDAASARDAALMAVLRSAVSMPMHAICALFTGLRLAVRDAQQARKEALVARASVAAVIGAMRFSGPGAPSHPGGVPVVVLADSGSGQHMVVPPSEVLSGAGSASGYADAGEMENPSSIRVWTWARVLWPAVLIHGTYDFVLICINANLAPLNDTAAVVVTTLIGLAFLMGSYLLFNSQLADSWEHIIEGRAPPTGLTCTTLQVRPYWWSGSAGFSAVSDQEEGLALAPLPTSTAPAMEALSGPWGRANGLAFIPQTLPQQQPVPPASASGAGAGNQAYHTNPYATASTTSGMLPRAGFTYALPPTNVGGVSDAQASPAQDGTGVSVAGTGSAFVSIAPPNAKGPD